MGKAKIWFLAGLLVLVGAVPAQGFFGYRFGWWGYHRTYWYPAAGPGVACWPAPVVHPAPLRPMVYSTPTAAPPSKEPPLLPLKFKPPVIQESRTMGGSYSGTYVAAGLSREKESGLFQVGFWNITGRDVALTVAGKRHVLKKGQVKTLELEREFSWQLESGEIHQETIPQDRTTHEVVLRP